MDIKTLQLKCSQMGFAELHALKILADQVYESQLADPSMDEQFSDIKSDKEAFSNMIDSVIADKVFEFIGEKPVVNDLPRRRDTLLV